jgi:hypothetical protein
MGFNTASHCHQDTHRGWVSNQGNCPLHLASHECEFSTVARTCRFRGVRLFVT